MIIDPQRFEHAESCPACAGGSLARFRKGTFAFENLRAEEIKITDSRYGRVWDLSRCRNCGHVFADPCPKPEFISSLYAAVEDPLYEEEAGGREKNFDRILDCLEKLRPEKGRLMDVGAATGILLNSARRRGWEPDGIDPSGWAVRTAREKYGLTVIRGAFETAPLEKKAYGACAMVDFIEHTPRPHAALLRANEILEDGGLLCLVTPDARSLAAKIAGRRWWHFRPAHIAYFSVSSLCALFRRTGFSVVKARSYDWTFSAHYLASRLAVSGFFLRNRRLASFLRGISIKLALGDSFEIYARKERSL